MPPEADHVRLAVDPAIGGRVLRKVGPAAWVVLQGLAMRSNGSRPTAQADTSVRELATELGISKDTVARAIYRLVDAKVVRRTTYAQDESGRFASRSYLVDLPAAGLQVLGPTRTEAQVPNKAEPRDAGIVSDLSLNASSTEQASTRRVRSRAQSVRAGTEAAAMQPPKPRPASAQPSLFSDT